MENVGDNDFRSLYRCVDEQLKEEEERQQTEMFLRLLDDLDARATTVPSSKHDNDDDYSSDEDGDYEIPSKNRRHRRIGRAPRLNKEFLKVSITDDEKTTRDKNKKEELERRELYGKVHTLDDLPPDESEFYKIFGGVPSEEPSDVNIEAGRRLKDGKIFYSAKFPGNIFDGMEIGSFSLELEYIIIFILIVFLVGVFIGKLSSNRKHNRTMQQLKRAHNTQLQSIQRSLLSYQYQQQSTPTPTPQPVYIPVPMTSNHIPSTTTTTANIPSS